jgi:hypothetical protein
MENISYLPENAPLTAEEKHRKEVFKRYHEAAKAGKVLVIEFKNPQWLEDWLRDEVLAKLDELCDRHLLP